MVVALKLVAIRLCADLRRRNPPKIKKMEGTENVKSDGKQNQILAQRVEPQKCTCEFLYKTAAEFSSQGFCQVNGQIQRARSCSLNALRRHAPLRGKRIPGSFAATHLNSIAAARSDSQENFFVIRKPLFLFC